MRFRPSDILRELEQGYRKKAEKKNIILHVRPGDNAQVFMGDSAKLRQILEYLLDNAIKFTPRGEVTLSMIMSAQPTRKSQTVRFSIEDTGIGIEAEKLTQIFEPFFQTCERTDPGAGLGLTIAQKLAELIHGHISVTSTAGKGSVFTLEAPLTLVMDGEAVP